MLSRLTSRLSSGLRPSLSLRSTGVASFQTATFSSTVDKSESDPDFVQAPVKPAEDASGVQAKIADLVKSNRVVLFMKGSPEAPQCGFSRAVVRVLAAEEVEDYVFADVLKSPTLREGVKKFSDWPTIPQLFVDGDFVGGCDIVVDMHQAGELKKLLKKEPSRS